jgi:hypothetical protein
MKPFFRNSKTEYMKKLLTHIACCLTAGMAFEMLTALSGCSLINDDAGDCSPTYEVRFYYDRNMKFADAFPQEVEAVRLYVLDDNNNVVYEKREEGSKLAEDGYAIPLPINPGTYKLLAWCSTNAKGSYTLVDNDGNTSRSDEMPLYCRINGIEGSTYHSKPGSTEINKDSIHVDFDLDALYHGLETNVTFPDDSQSHTAWVGLTKDTNRVRILLQHLSGEPLDVDNFDFSVDADNGLMHYDNSVIPNNPVVYKPHHISSGNTDLEGTSGGVLSVAQAELTTGRLVTSDEPRLNVRLHDTGETIISVPIKDYILMMKGYEWASMDDQEYLDRQEEYNFTFFLDERDRWIDAYIYINSWKLVLQNRGI